MISADLTERCIYSRITQQEQSIHSFDYLLGVWKSASNLRYQLNQFEVIGVPVKHRLPLIEEIINLAVNYAGLVLNPEMEELFSNPYGAGYIGHLLLNSADIDRKLPKMFMDQFIERFLDEGLVEMLKGTIKSIMTVMRTKNVSDDYHSCFRAFTWLISKKELAKLITELPEWDPAYAEPRSMEILSVLGPFLARTSIMPDSDVSLASKYFGANNMMMEVPMEDVDHYIGARNRGEVKSTQSSLRETSATVQKTLHSLILSIIKSDPAAKKAVLKYFSHCISLNLGRGKLHVDRTAISTDAFMQNIYQVCLLLCDPIMDPSFSKIGLIDVHCFIRSSEPHYMEDTKINADKELCQTLWSQFRLENPATPLNFVTDIFCITLAFAHYGFMSSLRSYGDLKKEVEGLRRHVMQCRETQSTPAWQASEPRQRFAHEMQFKHYEAKLDSLIGQKLLTEAVVFDRQMLQQTLRFYGLVMVWILKCASGNTDKSVSYDLVSQGDIRGLKLFPLSEFPPMEFATLPEWIIEDICDFYLFIAKNKPNLFENEPRNEFMAFSMVILSNSKHIKNPYLKSKIVEVPFN